jgi:hypothetical protein
MELLPELFKRPEHDSLPDTPHGVKVKVEVVNGVERRGRHLPRDVEMPQVRA